MGASLCLLTCPPLFSLPNTQSVATTLAWSALCWGPSKQGGQSSIAQWMKPGVGAEWLKETVVSWSWEMWTGCGSVSIGGRWRLDHVCWDCETGGHVRWGLGVQCHSQQDGCWVPELHILKEMSPTWEIRRHSSSGMWRERSLVGHRPGHTWAPSWFGSSEPEMPVGCFTPCKLWDGRMQEAFQHMPSSLFSRFLNLGTEPWRR